MPTVTRGRSFYQTDDVSGSSINYNFDALSDSDIVVAGIDTDTDTRSVFTESVDYTLDSSTKTVTVIGASWSALNPDIDLVRVYRTTTTASLVDFQNAGTLSQADLDNAYKQGLFVAQEVSEDASDLGAGGPSVIITDYIEDNAITSSKLSSLSVTEAKLASNSVTTSKINDGAVTTAKLDDDSVTTAKIADANVTTAKIADDSVTYDKVDVATNNQMLNDQAAGVVTPDNLKFARTSPRAFGSVTYDGTANPPTLTAAYNVSAATSLNTTERSITFDTPLASSNYCVLISGEDIINYHIYVVQGSRSTTGFTIKGSSAGSSADKIDFVVFGSSYI